MAQIHPIKVIAHRGTSAYFPENTLPAFLDAATTHQVDMIELDIHETKDGVPVVMHDARLERTTNGCGFVNQLNWDDLKNLDAGFHFQLRNRTDYPFRGGDCRIPRFEEVLEALPGVPLAVEIKEASAALTDKIMGLLRQYDISPECIVGSKYDPVSKRMKEAYPETMRFCSRADLVKILLELKNPLVSTPAEDGFAVASVPLSSIKVRFDTEEWINHLKTKKMRSFFWTIDDPNDILRLAGLGANGIITNDPGTANRTLGRRP